MTLLAKRQERSIVPRMYYITTAIDYTNGPPHIGHAYEKVLADVLARWRRMKGRMIYHNMIKVLQYDLSSGFISLRQGARRRCF